MEVISNSGLNYNCCLLTVGIDTVAVFKNFEQSFKIFDSHSKDFYGMPHSFGKCTFLSIEGLENLVSYLQMSYSEEGVVPFEIKGVLISDCQPYLEGVQNSQKNEGSPSNDKNNPKQFVNRKRKCSGETADIREKRLIARCEYERKRKANESEVFFWLSGQGFSCILGTSEQSVGCRRGVGVEKNNTCNYLASALFTITKKHIFYVCLTNTVQQTKFYYKMY